MRAEHRTVPVPVPYVDACERSVREYSHIGCLDGARARNIVNAESYS